MGYNQDNPFSRKSSPLNSFDSLVTKLEGQGKSHEAATKIAGSVANAKMHGAGSGPTAKQKARHGVSRQPGKPVEENRMTKGDQMPSRKSSSPLNNTGVTGLNYSNELQYMPIEDDMNRGMSRKPNIWEEEDVKRGREEEEEGHKGYADALYDDAHDSYDYDGHNSTGAESPTHRSSSKLREKAMKLSKGVEQGDYDYENPTVQKLLAKARKKDERSGKIGANMGRGYNVLRNETSRMIDERGGSRN